MKTIVLFTLLTSNPETDVQKPSIAGFFNTVLEAQTYALTLEPGQTFHIFNLYATGVIQGITWTLGTDPATNGLENAKSKAAARATGIRHNTKWTPREISVLIKARQDCISIHDISETLGRTPAACFFKISQLKKQANADIHVH